MTPLTRAGLIVAVSLACGGAALGQDPNGPDVAPRLEPTPVAPDTVAPVDPAPTGDAAANGPTATPAAAISGNPAAVNILVGTGKLGEFLGLKKDGAVRVGGVWVGDASGVLAGGLKPGRWGLNSLGVVDLSIDAEKAVGWKGGMFGIDFLQFSGQPTNELAGSFPGFDSLPGAPPLTRQEIYELWWRQELGDKFYVRAGKMVPTYDFNNVSKPVPVADEAAAIPSVTGVIFTPIFVNPTMLGVMPGYYNSATGIMGSFTPTEQTYISYGAYDGSLAIGEQTGLMGPQFDGHYYHIGEVGFAYRLGSERKPGMSAVGVWRQTGPLKAVNGATVDGANGVYAFGSQRLWFRHPGIDNSGVSGYYQLGANNTNVLAVRQYAGAGLTAFGLVPGRKDDSFGWGAAWSFMNTDPNAGAAFFRSLPGTSFAPSELILQWYYQMAVRPGAYFQPTVTYIPNPSARPGVPDVFAFTARLTLLF